MLAIKRDIIVSPRSFGNVIMVAGSSIKVNVLLWVIIHALGMEKPKRNIYTEKVSKH